MTGHAIIVIGRRKWAELHHYTQVKLTMLLYTVIRDRFQLCDWQILIWSPGDCLDYRNFFKSACIERWRRCAWLVRLSGTKQVIKQWQCMQCTECTGWQCGRLQTERRAGTRSLTRWVAGPPCYTLLHKWTEVYLCDHRLPILYCDAT